MDVMGWEQMAEWWDHHLGDDGDLWHRTLIDPPVFKLVGAVAGQRVLDRACGNGYMSRRFARQGAHVSGVDANAAIIERAHAREAREPLGITYHVADAAQLAMLDDQSVDLVVCNMAPMDIADVTGAIHEVARVVVARGSWLVARGSWLVARGSWLVARGSWLVARGSCRRGVASPASPTPALTKWRPPAGSSSTSTRPPPSGAK